PSSAVVPAVARRRFDFRRRPLVPVAPASVAAAAVRRLLVATEPIFGMPMLARPSGEALAMYALVGALIGWVSVYVTRAVYWIEDLFEHLPVHWMWWPAIGGGFVGAIGIISPHKLGVGYDNIEGMVAGRIVGAAVLWLCGFKFL